MRGVQLQSAALLVLVVLTALPSCLAAEAKKCPNCFVDIFLPAAGQKIHFSNTITAGDCCTWNWKTNTASHWLIDFGRCNEWGDCDLTNTVIDSEEQFAPWQYNKTFTKPGTYHYYCALHQQMSGVVYVKAAGAGGPPAPKKASPPPVAKKSSPPKRSSPPPGKKASPPPAKKAPPPKKASPPPARKAPPPKKSYPPPGKKASPPPVTSPASAPPSPVCWPDCPRRRAGIRRCWGSGKRCKRACPFPSKPTKSNCKNCCFGIKSEKGYKECKKACKASGKKSL